MKINRAYAETFANNCPVLEYTADGQPVGTCTYHTPKGICPRHGDWKAQYDAQEAGDSYSQEGDPPPRDYGDL